MDNYQSTLDIRRPRNQHLGLCATHLGFVQRTGESDRVFIRRTGAQGRPRTVKVSHVSGNSIDVLHCPFCGSGAVVARSDGTIECTFCTSVFTVQVQPQFAAFPQTTQGQPYPWPGQPDPASVVAPGGNPMAAPGDPSGGVGGAPQDISPAPGEDSDEDLDEVSPDPEDEDEPPAASVGGKDKPPFGKGPTKKKSYRTGAGHELGEDDYLRHLAIEHAHHRPAVIAMVRQGRRR